MKKVHSILLSVCLLVALLLPASAAPAVSLTPTAKRDGSLVTVTLPLPANSGFATFLGTLEYDKDQLSLLTVEFGAGSVTMYKDEVLGEVTLSAIWTEEQKEAATLCTITFAVKKDSTAPCTFVWRDIEVTNANDAPILVSFANGGKQVLALSGQAADGGAEQEKAPDAPNVPSDANGAKPQGETDTGKVDIPKTAGTYIAIGVSSAALLGIGVLAAVLVKKKKQN